MPRLIVWAHPAQRPLIGAVRDAGSFEIVAALSPRSQDAALLAAELEVARADDLRQALERDDLDAVWLAAPVESDVLIGRTVPIVSSEPLPSLPAGEAAVPLPFAPLFRRSPGYSAALDVLETFGPPTLINVSVTAPESCGSLFARLYDAMDLITAHAGPVEGVDAALRDGVAPERLEELTGELAVFLRFTGPCAAAATLSNCAEGWSRRVEFVGPGGRILIDDDRFSWWHASRRTPDTGGHAETSGPAQLFADAIRTRIGGATTIAIPPTDTHTVVGLCEAICLSTRTRQEEAPLRLAEVLRRR